MSQEVVSLVFRHRYSTCAGHRINIKNQTNLDLAPPYPPGPKFDFIRKTAEEVLLKVTGGREHAYDLDWNNIELAE